MITMTLERGVRVRECGSQNPAHGRAVTVRPARGRGDLGTVGRLGEAYHAAAGRSGEFDAGWCVRMWGGLMDSGTGMVWLAERGGKPAGAIAGMIHPHPMNGRLYAQEGFWFMAPGERGGTAGPRLFAAFEQWARRSGATGIFAGMNIDESPDGLDAFYRRKGYRARFTAYESKVEDGI